MVQLFDDITTAKFSETMGIKDHTGPNSSLRAIRVRELAQMLGLTEKTVARYVTEFPNRLPPRLNVPGRRVVWLEEDVLTWLRKCKEKPKRPERPRNNPKDV